MLAPKASKDVRSDQWKRARSEYTGVKFDVKCQLRMCPQVLRRKLEPRRKHSCPRCTATPH
jgi:hypothetical protein